MSKKGPRQSSSASINMSRPKVDLTKCPDYTWVFEMFNKHEKQYHSVIGSINQEYLKEITTKLQDDLVKSNRKKVQISETMKEGMKNISTQFIGLMNKLNDSNYDTVMVEFSSIKIATKTEMDAIVKLFVECIETEKSKLLTTYIRLLYDLSAGISSKSLNKWVFDGVNFFVIVCNQIQFHYNSVIALVNDNREHMELLCQLAKIIYLLHQHKMLASKVYKSVYEQLSNMHLYEALIALVNEEYTDANVAFFQQVLNDNLYDSPRTKRIIMNWLDKYTPSHHEAKPTDTMDEYEYEERVFHLLETYYTTSSSVSDLFSLINNPEQVMLNVIKYHLRERITNQSKYLKLMHELNEHKKIKLTQLPLLLKQMEKNKEDYMFDYPYFDVVMKQLHTIKH